MHALPTVFLSLILVLMLAVHALAAQPVKPALERADFLITGTSCAACLMRIEDKIKKTPGVVKAAVSIFKPYSAIVIFDSKKTNMHKVYDSMMGEPVMFSNIKEHPIDKLPAILLPAGS